MKKKERRRHKKNKSCSCLRLDLDVFFSLPYAGEEEKKIFKVYFVTCNVLELGKRGCEGEGILGGGRGWGNGGAR